MNPSTPLNPMNPSSQMASPADFPLRDIHLPDAISFWPPAIGWWLLPIVITLIVIVIVAIIRWQKRLRPMKAALIELDQIEERYKSSNNALLLAQELSALMRRGAITLLPKDKPTAMQGEEWLRFLDEPLPVKGFLYGPGQVLIDAPYRQNPTVQAPELIALCRSWFLKVRGGQR